VISNPRGWTVHNSIDQLLLVHPNGLASGAIRYRDRIPGLAPVSRLIERALVSSSSTSASFEASSSPRVEPIVTHEGEHAALATVPGRIAGELAQHDFGLVFHDDSYSLIASLSIAEELFVSATARVRQLTTKATFQRALRPRRPLYPRPNGWLGVARGLTTEWYSPDSPSDEAAAMTIWPALPTAGLPEDFWHALWRPDHGYELSETSTRFQTRSGLNGRRLHARHAETLRERAMVVLSDQRFSILARFETGPNTNPNHKAAFSTLLESIVPVPSPSPKPASMGEAFAHWTS